jgi:hypothetical protein
MRGLSLPSTGGNRPIPGRESIERSGMKPHIQEIAILVAIILNTFPGN